MKDKIQSVQLCFTTDSFMYGYPEIQQTNLAALRALHDASCKTWVSIEPYPTPNLKDQSLGEILESVSFVDRVIFRRTNYNTTVSAYRENKRFYNECAEEVIAFCKERDISYHIKAKTMT